LYTLLITESTEICRSR